MTNSGEKYSCELMVKPTKSGGVIDDRGGGKITPLRSMKTVTSAGAVATTGTVAVSCISTNGKADGWVESSHHLGNPKGFEECVRELAQGLGRVVTTQQPYI